MPPGRLAVNDPGALTLLLCDDHTLFREALAVLLEQQAGWRVVGQAGDGAEAVRLAVELTPDVAVLDIAMPGISGIDAAQRIRDARPGIHIVALSMYGDTYYRQRMLCAGAQAFVPKNEAGGELIQAIEAVLRGETYVSAALREGTVPQPQPQYGGPLAHAKLTPRECDVLRLLAEGQRTKEIAKAMAISPPRRWRPTAIASPSRTVSKPWRTWSSSPSAPASSAPNSVDHCRKRKHGTDPRPPDRRLRAAPIPDDRLQPPTVHIRKGNRNPTAHAPASDTPAGIRIPNGTQALDLEHYRASGRVIRRSRQEAMPSAASWMTPSSLTASSVS